MIRVIATFKLQPGMIDEAREIAEILVNETRKEDGCLQYDLLQDVKDENHLVMVEHWENKEKLDAHSASEHFTKHVPRLASLCVEEPKIEIFKSMF